MRAGVANPGKACGFDRVFHLLDISSVEQFEGWTKIYGIMEFFLLEVSSADQIEHLAEILFGAK